MNAQVYADRLVETIVEGKSIKLTFDDRMLRILKGFAEIESRLVSSPFKAKFLIGAGDLRRAILAQSSEGPGDFEVFIHFEGGDFSRYNLKSALAEIRDKTGIDLKYEIRKLVGEDVKLDIFMKSATALKAGQSYLGEFGLFEGFDIADTSVNQLRYSPSENTLMGTELNLRALAEKRILFTEPSKAEPKPKEVKPPEAKLSKKKIQKWTSNYKETILRLALRSIRLKLDLETSPNPNKIQLDSNFNQVLKGFELYFEGAGSQELSGFQMDSVYLEQFIKLFNKKSSDERAKIESILVRDHSNTLRLWESLGLNWKFLVSNERSFKLSAEEQWQALKGQALYSDLAKVLTPTGKQIKKPSFIKLSTHLIELYSPLLKWKLEHFEILSRDEKLKTYKDYVAAAAFYSAQAAKKLNQVSYRENLFSRMGLVWKEKKGVDSEMIVSEFLAKQAEPIASSRSSVSSSDFNRSLLGQLTKAINKAVRDGYQPVLAFDLDRTLIDVRPRYLELLKAYDFSHSTKFFSNLKLEELEVDRDQFREFIFERIRTGSKSEDVLENLESVLSFVNLHNQDPEFLKFDRFQPAMKKRILDWQKRGARILFVTARHEYLRTATNETLGDIKPLELLMREQRFGKKAEQIADWISRNPGTELTALFENERSELSAVTAKFGRLKAVRVHMREDEEVFLMREDEQLLEIGISKNCRDRFALLMKSGARK